MSKKVISGVVSSDKADKTIVVNVERVIMHPIYKKFYRSHKKYVAHDENNEARTGDTVKIEESKPLSKRKRWKLAEITERSVDFGAESKGE